VSLFTAAYNLHITTQNNNLCEAYNHKMVQIGESLSCNSRY